MALVFGAQIISALPHTAVAAELEKLAQQESNCATSASRSQQVNKGGRRGVSSGRHNAVLPRHVTEPSPNTKADIDDLSSREALLVEELERTRSRKDQAQERFRAQQDHANRKRRALMHILAGNDFTIESDALYGPLQPGISVNHAEDNVVSGMNESGQRVFDVGLLPPHIMQASAFLEHGDDRMDIDENGSQASSEELEVISRALPVFQLPIPSSNVLFINRVPERQTLEVKKRLEQQKNDRLRVQQTLGLSTDEMLEFEISPGLRKRRGADFGSWQGDKDATKNTMDGLIHLTTARNTPQDTDRRAVIASAAQRSLVTPNSFGSNQEPLFVPGTSRAAVAFQNRHNGRRLKQRNVAGSAYDPKYYETTNGNGRVVDKKTGESNVNPSALRRELNESLQAVRYFTNKVNSDIAEINQICPQSNIRAKMYMARVGRVKLKTMLYKLTYRNLSIAFRMLAVNTELAKKKDKREKYLRLQGATKLGNVLKRHQAHSVALRLEKWMQVMIAMCEYEKLAVQHGAAKIIQRNLWRWKLRDTLNERATQTYIRRQNEAALSIQARMRGSRVRRRLSSHENFAKQKMGSVGMQRVFRGYKGRKVATAKRMQVLNEHNGALKLQTIWRRRRAKDTTEGLRFRKRSEAITKIQTIQRRKKANIAVGKKRVQRHRKQSAMSVQAIFRGRLGRKKAKQNQIEKIERDRHRNLNALNIQRVYRGHRGRIVTMLRRNVRRAELAMHEVSIIKIQAVVRGRLDRLRVDAMREEYERDLAYYARAWTQTTDPSTNTVYFVNSFTQESMTEPPAEGYARDDGMLVLANGRVVLDPIAEDKRIAEAHLPRCVECEDEVATRQCNECIDHFCVACYDSVHARGKLADHSFVVTYSPLDDEYERVMAAAGKGGVNDQSDGNGWEEYFDEESGAPYWYSTVTQETRWDDPALDVAAAGAESYREEYANGEISGGVASAMQQFYDEASGLPYWLNLETQETTWEDPGVYAVDSYASGTEDNNYDTGEVGAGSDEYQYADAEAEYQYADTEEYQYAEGAGGEYQHDTAGGDYQYEETGGDYQYEDTGGAVWEQYVDDGTGLPYWFNTQTQETTWEDPHA